MRSSAVLTVVLAALVACASVACSAPSPGPDVTVLQWMQAFAGQDGTTIARLTCRANQADTQNSRLLSMALGVPVPTFGAGGGGAGQFIGGGGGQAQYDVSDLRYETVSADDKNARVQVTGLLRLVSGLASQVLRMNTTVGLTREQELWRVCDTPVAS
jgi:hypothetical protein